ncbi:MAG: c-type cytochrome [Cyclobacteriaceae bacterium]|nr:c-type cytochrome [Cyclobacteriaceae bacterium]
MFATQRSAYLSIITFVFSFFILTSAWAQSDTTDVESTDQPTTEAATSQGGISSDPAVITAGEALFQGNCRACHAVNQKLVGPALAGIYDRQDMDWIKAFVKNSQAMIASGDEYSVALYEEYNNTMMTSFNFSDEEIESIIAYVKFEAENAAAAAETPEGVPEDGTTTTATGPSKYLTAVIVGLVVVLLLILIVLFLILGFLTKFLKERKDDLDEADREMIDQKFDFGKLTRNPAFIGIVAFIFGIFVVKAVLDGLYQVGIQQGYAPKQPIAFSHKLHAGQYEIDCNYCHTGVRKSKSANIPSANICMNCHGQIKTESPEIQKIYAAIEENTPIEWVRVHNLPDLAYFNHAQHVAVGNQECESCHGEIKEMEVVEQFAPLTMGWCINCHKETNINTKGNAYYDNLVELHSQHSKEPLKVEDLGGLECAKCHY